MPTANKFPVVEPSSVETSPKGGGVARGRKQKFGTTQEENKEGKTTITTEKPRETASPTKVEKKELNVYTIVFAIVTILLFILLNYYAW